MIRKLKQFSTFVTVIFVSYNVRVNAVMEKLLRKLQVSRVSRITEVSSLPPNNLYLLFSVVED